MRRDDPKVGCTRSYQNALVHDSDLGEDEMGSKVDPAARASHRGSARPARRGAVGSPSHPLADVARRRCQGLHQQRSAGAVVACGECWERAIRDDERAVVLFGLPREIEPDPGYVDEVAVERAVAGHRQRLTPVEEARAVAILLRRGWSDTRIAEWLGIRAPRVIDLRSGVLTTEVGKDAA